MHPGTKPIVWKPTASHTMDLEGKHARLENQRPGGSHLGTHCLATKKRALHMYLEQHTTRLGNNPS
eukprot:4964335-Lingulodinium_polyedra.AAC.1